MVSVSLMNFLRNGIFLTFEELGYVKKLLSWETFSYLRDYSTLEKFFHTSETFSSFRTFSTVEKHFHVSETFPWCKRFSGLINFSYFTVKGSLYEKHFHCWGAFTHLRDFVIGFFLCEWISQGEVLSKILDLSFLGFFGGVPVLKKEAPV